MATNLLWFVMAGFLLGFATSTLWEWFYFRKERLKLTDRRIRELEAKLREAEPDIDSISAIDTASITSSSAVIPTVASVTGSSPRTSAWGEPPYRSPGVFLESEEYGAEAGDSAAVSPERGRSRSEGAPYSPYVPTVNSITNSTAPAPHAATPSTSQTTQPFAPEPGRVEPPSPADALRAKRTASPRSRQEVLAELRRNSEAVRRGQALTGEEAAEPAQAPSAFVPPTSVPRTSTLVSPSPDNQEVPIPPAAPTPVQERFGGATAQTATSDEAAPPQSAARQRWANDPELTQRTREYPDDLSKIKGIGDVYKQRLYRAGIYTWKQIAETDEATLRRAVSANQSSNISEWYGQAEQLMEKFGRGEAVYTGPPPDDLTKILGIGPVGASVLYRAGVCTYEQLASTSISDLATLFPVAVAGDQPDFAQWIARAEKLADQKHEAV